MQIRRSLFEALIALTAWLDRRLPMEKLVLDRRNNIFVVASLLMLATIVPSAVVLVRFLEPLGGQASG